MALRKSFKHPFTNVVPGEYTYSRPAVRGIEVTVTENAGQLFMKFPHHTRRYKMSQLPFDAELTTIE